MISGKSSPTRPYLVQIIFFIVVLYAVCAMTALLLILFLVPEQSIDTKFFILAAMLAFGTMELTSAYHLSTMVRRKKRKTDREIQGSQTIGFGEILAVSHFVSRILFFVIVFYGIGALVFIVPVFGTVSRFPQLHFNPRLLLLFSVTSFGLTAFISIYHLSTMVRRRKRKTDRE
ncbi:hypothetical protein AGMMS49928_29040 [Spirochaetia bacterium]|nr:hypothetical protein AGMMS49928_29040 [Spirochaetia bacterium]